MLMPGRNGGSSYRYNFQGQESDDEVKGKGNSVSYKYRMHDPRLGRFFAVDPLTHDFPYWTPYQFSGNQVISTWELEGREANYNLNVNENTTLQVRGNSATLEQLNASGLRFRHSTGNHYTNPIPGDWVQINCSNCKTATGTVLLKVPTANIIRTKIITVTKEREVKIKDATGGSDFDKKQVEGSYSNTAYKTIASGSADYDDASSYTDPNYTISDEKHSAYLLYTGFIKSRDNPSVLIIVNYYPSKEYIDGLERAKSETGIPYSIKVSPSQPRNSSLWQLNYTIKVKTDPTPAEYKTVEYQEQIEVQETVSPVQIID